MPKKKMGTKKIAIVLFKPEEDIILQAEEKGYNVSEIMRYLIREWGKVEFPPVPEYAKALAARAKIAEKRMEDETKIEQMDERQYAEEILMGQVRGDKVYFRTSSGYEVDYPLEGIKHKKPESNEVIAIHQKLLDKSFTWYNGKPIDDKEWKDIFEGWDEHRPAKRDSGYSTMDVPL